MGRFSSLAVFNHSRVTVAAFANASACVAPSAMQPGKSGISANGHLPLARIYRLDRVEPCPGFVRPELFTRKILDNQQPYYQK
jgi:hypothetical protein